MKKVILRLVIVLLVLSGITVGGTVLYRKHKAKTNPAKVYSVSGSGFVGNYYETPSTMDGSVTKNNEQDIYAENGATVSKVTATVGDAVKAGDSVVIYDTQKQSYQLASAKANLDVYNINLQIANNDLEKLEKTTPIPDEPKVDPSVEGMTDEIYNQIINDVPNATDTDAIKMKNIAAEQYPSYKQWVTNCDAIRKANAAIFGVAVDKVTDYTAASLATAIRDQKNKINDAKLKVDNQNLSVRKNEKNVDDATVKAKINGVITMINTSADNISAGKPIVSIKSDGSFSAVVNVDEFHLDAMKIGDSVTVTSYDTGNTYSGTVTNVSTTPIDDDSSGYTNSATSSYYPVTISIDGSQDLKEGAYVSVQSNGTVNADLSNEVVLPLFMVKKEKNSYFTYKEDGGKLKKVFLNTGKIYYGQMIEVKSGITADDKIAFPYDKNAKEGRSCVDGQLSDLESE